MHPAMPKKPTPSGWRAGWRERLELFETFRLC